MTTAPGPTATATRPSDDDALRRALGWIRRPTVSAGLLLGLFLLIPIVVIVPASFNRAGIIVFPPRDWSWRWYGSALGDTEWRASFWLSVRLSLQAGLLATVAGTLAALGLRRTRKGARWLRTLFVAPLVLPGVAYGLGLSATLHRTGLSGRTWPIAAGQAVVAFPLVVIVVSSALARVDPDVIRAAHSLGAGWPMAAWRVELPLIRRSVLAAAVFAVAIAFDELVVALFVAPPGVRTLPVALFSGTREDLRPDIASVSVMTTLLVVALLAGASLLLRDQARSATVEG